MAIFIQTLNNSQNEQKFLVTPGFIIGNGINNTPANIIITGRNVAPVHAKVLEDERGQLVLICSNITSEIIVNARGVKRVFLKHGVHFKIENHSFKVIEEKSYVEIPNSEKSQASLRFVKPSNNKIIDNEDQTLMVQTATIEAPKESIKTESASEILIKTLKLIVDLKSDNFATKKPSEKIVRPLKKVLRITVTQGLQADKEFFIGWGPRIFGSSANEFQLFDPIAPAESFIIFPAQNGETFFITKHPDLVKLNDESQTRQILNDNDIIKFGDTILRVNEI